MNNLDLYERVRAVPKEAQKPIVAGRLKGMTDINPMWRIKKLTEEFGVCGIGWKPEIVRTWIDSGANEEAIANVEIRLYVKSGDGWSDGIPGIGGSKFISKENGGLHTDDECYKKAYTDALSVACKYLGIGADVYYAKDSSKYEYDSGAPEAQVGTLKGKLKTITKEEVESYGVQKVDDMIAYLENQFNKNLDEFTEEDNAEARGWLRELRDRRKNSKARQQFDEQ